MSNNSNIQKRAVVSPSARRVALLALCLLAPVATSAAAQTTPAVSDTKSTAKLAASVKTVFDDGTIVLKIGSSPFRCGWTG
ncbi:hypothetical protein [Deinococcus peraridilitoris]|uniref:Uncharacterized protein n=1 Tax=Deinococcus peraridilitoris (strain DSM 19664 / LMG 22246 / CIP 109416 / KR-200) TaxID=937777 RepID=L0A4N1_DEIPD|nr:hypothetical protein [Deinococcus peraridilitoris]AFZ68112.1 hypothetical protein Deipe_2647 [Deinococcus peraridilitoris DSM 19664]